MDIEMEKEVQKRLHKYHMKMAVTGGIILVDIVYLVYVAIYLLDPEVTLWTFGDFGSFLLEVTAFLAYGGIAFIAILNEAIAKKEIEKILFEECDPFLYEACVMRMKTPFYKDRVKCNLAVARYFQGNIDGAYDTFMQIRTEKLKRGFALNYYSVLSGIYFLKGMGQQVPELEQACRRNLSKNKKGQERFAYLCASNNYQRALANEDYASAFRFLQEGAVAPNNIQYKLHVMIYNYNVAKIYIKMGEKVSARWNLECVKTEGNKLFMVQKAEEMLKSMEETQI